MTPIEKSTILITGATDGLGQGIALDLAAKGATVLLHGRDPERIARTVDAIRAQTPSARVRTYRADLASLADVRALAKAVSEGEPRLDVLVNNAGIGANVPGGGKRMTSEDGHELRFAVNYLSHWLLTRLLLPTLKTSAPSRIVNVSSAGQAPIDFDDPMMITHGYNGVRAYCQSKLAQILSTVDLAEELAGSGVTVTALHPATYMPTKIVPSPISTLEEGVDATVRLVADPSLDHVSGRYFDGVDETRANAQAYDPSARRRLRELSEKLSSRA
ncbi:MAG TPA: SDR family NAD(P)-dependent oxidoreductase [Gemmatimonadaceae bacterium]|nr:SDR family NAD(P)-dependent oxidoreductase [Gemmatimonadaceae bacterium]